MSSTRLTVSRLGRVKLAAAAVAGIVAYNVVLMGPFVALMALNPWSGYYGVWPIVAVVLLLWWTMQPFHVTPGTPVTREQAPRLFDDVQALARQIGAPHIDEIRLVDDFNAAAIEAPVRWRPWRKQRVLVLGVPLLALADTRMLSGVIAHELGHFSHRHGRLGHWLYRARAGWVSYANEPIAELSILERAAAFFAHWFAPRFSRLSFNYSRACEYEADAYGASVVGRVPMACGLLTIACLGRRWQDMADRELPQLLARQDAPPNDWMAHVQRRVLDQPPQPEEWARLQVAAADPHDTHPSTGERIRALAVSGHEVLAACHLPVQVAGAAWFADWAAVLARFNDAWRDLNASTWRQEHIRQRHQRQRLESLRSAADRSVARAQLELEYGEPATVMSLADGWLDDAAVGAQARFLRGVAQLKLGDKQGVATLEACIKASPPWALAAREWMAQHAALLETDEQRERNTALLTRALDKRARALGLAFEKMQQGEIAPARLDEDSWSILREVYTGSVTVAAAWCAGLDELVHDGRCYQVVLLVLRLRTERLQALGLSEDELRDEARALLGGLLPGSVLRLVWTVYTTEPLAPELDARLMAWASSGERCCLVAPQPGESVGAGARAAALR